MKAAGHLRNRIDQDGHLPGFLPTNWLAGGLWAKLGQTETAERVFEDLTNYINDLAASNLAWLVITLRLAGIKPDNPLVEAAMLLKNKQEDDGRWKSEDGPDQDVHANLEAFRALKFTGLAG